MLKIDNVTAKPTRDAIDPPGTEGWFTEGDPVLAEEATVLPADFLNDLQAILRAVIDAGSVTPTKGPGGDADLLNAIRVVVNQGVPQGHLIGRLKRTGVATIELQPSSGVNVLVGIDNKVLSNTGPIVWDMASHLEGGEAPSTAYYLYLRENPTGVLDPQISATVPDLPGGTKPNYKSGDTSRRCVGSIWNRSTSAFIECTYGPGGKVLFHEHDGDHEHSLLVSQGTSWKTEVLLNLPVTALIARISATADATSSGGGFGMNVYGVEGASGTLTDGSFLPASFPDIIAAALKGGSSNRQGMAVNFDLPIITPAAPKLAYGITQSLTSGSHWAIVTGYTDLFAPR